MSIEKGSIRKDLQPFREPIGDKFGNGTHCEVYELGDDYLIKVLHTGWNLGNGEKRLVETHRLINEYLGNFIPATFPIYGVNAEGKNSMMLLQRRINGRSVRDISWEELKGNEGVIDQFKQFTIRAYQMYRDVGKAPDVHGTTLGTVGHFDVKLTNNMIIDQCNKIWLIDTELMGPLWSSKWVLGKLHNRYVMDGLIEFTSKLLTD